WATSLRCARRWSSARPRPTNCSTVSAARSTRRWIGLTARASRTEKPDQNPFHHSEAGKGPRTHCCVLDFGLNTNKDLNSLCLNKLGRLESAAGATSCSINMPQRSRPYFQSSFRELNELFLSNQNDAVVLAALLE